MATKKPAAKKVAKKAVVSKKLPIAKEMYTKNEILRTIAERAGVAKKQVGEMFNVLMAFRFWILAILSFYFVLRT